MLSPGLALRDLYTSSQDTFNHLRMLVSLMLLLARNVHKSPPFGSPWGQTQAAATVDVVPCPRA